MCFRQRDQGSCDRPKCPYNHDGKVIAAARAEKGRERKEVGLARPGPPLRRTRHGLRPRTRLKPSSPRDRRKVGRKEDPVIGPPPLSPTARAVVLFGLATTEKGALARPGRPRLGVPMGTRKEARVPNRVKASPRAYGFSNGTVSMERAARTLIAKRPMRSCMKSWAPSVLTPCNLWRRTRGGIGASRVPERGRRGRSVHVGPHVG